VVILEFLVQVVELLQVALGEAMDLLVLLVVKVLMVVMVVLGLEVIMGRTPVLVVQGGRAAMLPLPERMVVLVVAGEIQEVLVLVVLLVLISNT
tara:strand:- start:85 stop:366 length:282 start_codon:yes stop_codon:yes gene_type:complete